MTTQANPASTSIVADLTGFAIEPSELARINVLLSEIDRLKGICEANGPGAARARLKDLVQITAENPTPANFDALGAAAAGDVEQIAALKRSAAKEALRLMGPRVAVVALPILERFASELRELIADREASEREQCLEMGVDFEPSAALRSLVRRFEITNESILTAEKAPELLPGNLRPTIQGLLATTPAEAVAA